MGKRTTHCKARTKGGRPCHAAASEGGLCFFHANPNKAAELGRIGGRKNRHFVVDGLDALPKIETAKEVRQTVSRLIADVHAGKLHPRIATGLAPLLSLQLRAIQITNIEERIARLEKSMHNLQTTDPAEEGQVKQETPESFRLHPASENDDMNEQEAP